MENFAVILKEEHTEVCILRPNIVIMVGNRGNGTISIDISDNDENGSSVQLLLDCGDFKGRYIEDYDKETQATILDSIETSVARDIAKFAEQGYTFVGVEKDRGEERSECFFPDVYWSSSSRRLLIKNLTIRNDIIRNSFLNCNTYRYGIIGFSFRHGRQA